MSDNIEMEIVTTAGGPCIYKIGILPDGRKTGRVQYIGQTQEELQVELLKTLETGRDDVASFVDSLFSKPWMP